MPRIIARLVNSPPSFTYVFLLAVEIGVANDAV
jgi:hypothetical protein